MDAMAMALHILYYTDSFEHAIRTACRLQGDADSVGSVVGQLAGAYYGIHTIPSSWIKKIFSLQGFYPYQLTYNQEVRNYSNYYRVIYQ